MTCKNCHESLELSSNFCANCGEKVNVSRVTFKALVVDVFINFLGVDSKFFKTLKASITKPDELITDVLNGVRKRYMNPFAFLAVGAALSLILFNFYADDFKQVNSQLNKTRIEEIKQKANIDLSKLENVSKQELQKIEAEKKAAQLQLKFNEGMLDYMLKYYNILAFLFVFLYAMLSKWTFWKPHNFGEHIVINAYLYGFTIYLSIILFILSLLITPSIYFYSILFYIIYYMYALGKLYKLSFGKNVLMFLKFLGGLVIVFLTLTILGIIVGVALAYYKII